MPKPLFDQPMPPAEKQARYRARKAQERKAERARADRATRELLHGLKSNLAKLCMYLNNQGDPAELALVLAELDGPELPFSMLEGAAGWLTRFAEAYRYAVLHQASLRSV